MAIFGPMIISALIGGDRHYTLGYTTMGIIALASIALPLITKMPRTRKTVDEGVLGEESVVGET